MQQQRRSIAKSLWIILAIAGNTANYVPMNLLTLLTRGMFEENNQLFGRLKIKLWAAKELLVFLQNPVGKLIIWCGEMNKKAKET